MQLVGDVLGLELRSLENGMRETFAWYRDQDRPPLDTSWDDDLIASPALGRIKCTVRPLDCIKQRQRRIDDANTD